MNKYQKYINKATKNEVMQVAFNIYEINALKQNVDNFTKEDFNNLQKEAIKEAEECFGYIRKQIRMAYKPFNVADNKCLNL